MAQNARPALPHPLIHPDPHEAVRRLSERLTSRLAREGAVRDRCASRVLESSLLYQLLRQQPGAHAGVTAELGCFLDAAHASATPFEKVLIGAVRTPEGRPRNALEPAWLTTFDHFTAGRKRLLVETVLGLLGVVPLADGPDPDRLSHTGFASWVELTLVATRVILVRARDRRDPGLEEELVQRLASGSGKAVWEGVALTHLLALHALRCCRPDHPLLDEGIRALVRCRNPDGGVPFIDGLEVFCTATAGLALTAATGADHRTVMAAGDYLADQQLPDGGWPFAERVRQSDVDDTAYCLQLLRALSAQRYAAHIQRGTAYLLEIANDDGGFPTFRRNHPSECAMTAGALTALARGNGHSREIARAARYLTGAQQPDGTFERSWSLSEANAIFRVIHALAAAKPRTAPADHDRMEQVTLLSAGRLLSTQNPDGGWGQCPGDESDPISTAYSLLAIARWPHTPAHRHGVSYLLSQQQPDGGYRSRPDQAAPRPLPYDVPVLADITALWALNERGPCAQPPG